MISDKIRSRLKAEGMPYAANDNISAHLSRDELGALEIEVAGRAQALLDALIIDTQNDPNANGTARRMAKMFIREVFRGRYEPMPIPTYFPNTRSLDEIYTLGPISVRSACSHHMVPIIGKAWVGVIPSDRVIGISKFTRIAEWVLARPQIQEEAVVMLADRLEELMNPKALAVMIKASHFCMSWRGVRDKDTSMVTSVMRGTFRESENARHELIELMKSQGF